MAWAALGKVAMGAVKGKVKQVAADKLLNRKKKTSKRRESAQKIVGGGEKKGSNQSEKGGALTVIPKSSLVSSPGGELSKKSAKPQEDVVYTIRTRVIEVDKLLKGTLASEKAQNKKEKKQKEDEVRLEQETDKEKKKPDKDTGKETPKSLVPKLGFLDGIKKFLSDVLMGWLTFRLIKFLPKIISFLKPAAAFVDWLIKWGGKLLNGLVTMIDWGYKAVEGTRNFIKDKFGEGAAEKFDAFTGALNKVMNIMIALGLAAAKFRKPKGPKGPKLGDDLDIDPKTKKKVKPDEIVDPKTNKVRKKTKTEIEIQKKNKLTNKQLDEIKVKKSKINPQTGKKFTTADAIADVKKPKGFAKWLQKGKDLGGKALRGTGDLILKGVKGAFNMLPDFGKLGPELMESIGTGYKNLKTIAQKRYDQVVDIGKKLKGKYDNALKSAGNYLNGLGTKAKNAFFERILGPVKKHLEPIVKRIEPIGKRIMGVLQKIPGYDKITKVLQKFGGAGSEGLLKKIGGKAIPILGGVINMAFAYDRLASGDSIGGMIEGLSGLLDLSALVGNAAGPGISMGLDAYMFARDFVPQIQGAENAVISKLGLMGLKTSMDSIFEKLPGLGEITKMITGGDKEKEVKTEKETTSGDSIKYTVKGGEVDPSSLEEGVPLEKAQQNYIEGEIKKLEFKIKSAKRKHGDDHDTSGMEKKLNQYKSRYNETLEFGGYDVPDVKGNSENILPLDVNSVSKKASSVSSSASYEETGGETIVVKSGSQEEEVPTDTTNNESLAPVVVGVGGGDSEVSDLLYKGG